MEKKHHSRNIHLNGYDLAKLAKFSPTLTPYLIKNEFGNTTIDFSDSKAVKALNQALLVVDYQLLVWDIPETNLCPVVPGRADLIHTLADLLAEQNNGDVPTGKNTQLLDIGTGASLIYPILANKIYGWKAVATDIDANSIKQAKNLAQFNKLPVKLRQQKSTDNIFHGVINANDFFDITCCNPPFHSSLDNAEKANQRKWKNLSHENKGFNFSGQKAELWCEGGEIAFLTTMINESADYQDQVGWFTSLVSKKENLPKLKSQLTRFANSEVKVMPLAHGQKVMHVLCWRFNNSPT
ncbi:23S rRNA (adenine(1618)-N(6))-methyltransferase RlmF [Pseudoalteromonas spongiae]|uniref:23S rRNA (adenine(1618)-N(6))-methyltransferase RlmF n=1 Tax=Pseudoalteromonas spongiae TaxID=298657 RepID=UPI00110C17BB|nr:23S rRNA (adenine(1618)-N(6))-methyltransferase RlmF [Pseudoalteromonas spongiae]TMO84660.1 23S rRNA (adenine(1618)-N(6))-methyltransferase RlmF [Pseudoalteromonas spongiae]